MADVCQGYDYALAVEDVVPIVLGGIGFFCLAQRVAISLPRLRPFVYFAATILVIGSAFAGPVRKAFLAGGAGCDSLDWMQIPFFSSLPVGFAILSWAVACLLAKDRITFRYYAIGLVVVFLVASLVQHSLPLIIVGGLLGVATGVEAAVLARREAGGLTALLFALYAIAILFLPALGSKDDRGDVGIQWAEQGTNTVAQAIFAVAAFRLLRAAASADRPGDRPAVMHPVEN